MRIRHWTTHFTLLVLFPIISLAAEAPTLASMLKTVMPSIVSIQVEVKPSAFTARIAKEKHIPEEELLGRIGSGVIIDAGNGYIVTNAHLVKNQKNMQVKLASGQIDPATLIGLDSMTDIAVIQVHDKHMTAIAFGDSDALQVGDEVAAVGSPFGLPQTVTSGIISALSRDNLGGGQGVFDSYIQTDAPINPGNSGGALITRAGAFVGMNTAIVTPQSGNVGIGFAIPSNIVSSISAQIIKHGKVSRGLVGVVAQDITPDMATLLHLTTQNGALVSGVSPHSPASQAGIQMGDIITALNDKPVVSSGDLVSHLGLYRTGTRVHFTVQRGTQTLTLSATIATPEAMQTESDKYNPYFNSVFLRNTVTAVPDVGTVTGVEVLAIAESSSNANLAGLLPGDIIVSVNNLPTPTLDALMHVTEISDHAPLLLSILRENKRAFFILKPAV